ncbi:MAG: twin-arginine translocase TatA/TatE family subunit [Actinomycetota bacterium]|nr:twin-arginine translocase TatA/TatE family subunit [Actinomycetota bacterium]HZY65587.1 twin-arginine translocase TatA/TatE family subunit [Rubrobacteraceae bacterium]
MGVPGPTELIILLVIILLLFGAKRIPELAKGLGSGMREFRKGSSGDYDEVDEENKKEEELTAGGGEEDEVKADSSADADREEQRQS